MPAEPAWVVNTEALTERSAPDEDSEPVASLRQFTYLAVTGYDGDWARVLDPRTGQTGFVTADGAFLWSWAGLGTLASIHY